MAQTHEYCKNKMQSVSSLIFSVVVSGFEKRKGGMSICICIIFSFLEEDIRNIAVVNFMKRPGDFIVLLTVF